MKTKEQIEEMAKKYTHKQLGEDLSISGNNDSSLVARKINQAFIESATQMQSDLLAEASEGFTDFWTKQRGDMVGEPSIKVSYTDFQLQEWEREAYEAGALSKMKEVEELKCRLDGKGDSQHQEIKELKKYKEMWQSIAGKANLEDLIKNNEELTRGAQELISRYDQAVKDMAEVSLMVAHNYIENSEITRHEEIRKKYNLDEKYKG